ncbi:MAG: LysM peptidoglycan-binding domain-containing protein [Candidatus Brocadiia bacterium]|nr:MAG: LysM peptidoglycan-binding domain-containing protein [Candidatus Brocadiia bacterium]
MSYYSSQKKPQLKNWIALLAIVTAIVLIKVYSGDKNPQPTMADLKPPSDAESSKSGSLTGISDSTRFSMDLPKHEPAQQAKAQNVTEQLTAVPPAPAQGTNGLESNDLIKKAAQYLSESPAKVIEARDYLNSALSTSLSSAQRKQAMNMLSDLSQKWLFSKTVRAGDKLSSTYKVAPGDTLVALGKQYKVPYEIIMQINNVRNPGELRAGDTIKVVDGPFNAKINRLSYTLDLYLQKTYVCSFPVGLGKEGRETPTGLWLVKLGGKLISPTWTDPDTGKTYEAESPDYPLGSRWIGLTGIKGNAKDRNGFALHGTKDNSSIGKSSSRGCIRMIDKDILLMYSLMMPGFSNVEVAD